LPSSTFAPAWPEVICGAKAWAQKRKDSIEAKVEKLIVEAKAKQKRNAFGGAGKID